MSLEMTFRNLEPTDAIRARAAKKYQKVEKQLRDPNDAHLVCSIEKHRHRAELTVHAFGETFRVVDESDDLYTSIDNVMNKLVRSAQRSRERKIDRSQGGDGVEPDNF